jgi:hypothetical protein
MRSIRLSHGSERLARRKKELGRTLRKPGGKPHILRSHVPDLMHQAWRKDQRAIRVERHCLDWIAISPNPLQNVDHLFTLMEVRRSRRSGREPLFPRFDRLGSIGFPSDGLMLKTGQGVDGNGGE